jgi:1-acyl-sn-glycerol-3-phosphate acyltransferase
VGLAAAHLLRVRLVLLGKQELFRFPLGLVLRGLGVVPVDRDHPHGAVGHAVDLLRGADRCGIGLAPEGTRLLRSHWRSGFYHIAVEAGVPIVCVKLDYAERAVIIAGTVVPTGDVHADMDRIRAEFAGVVGRHPAFQTPIRLEEEDQGPQVTLE